MKGATEYDTINDAIVRLLGSYWSKQAEQDITDAYGPEIAARTKAVYDEAMDCPVDWSKDTMDDALAKLADFIPARFPWISKEAKTHLNFCYIMAFK